MPSYDLWKSFWMHLKQKFHEKLVFFQESSSKFLPFSVWKHQFFMELLLQMHQKTFLEVVRRHPRYLEGAPTSRDYNAPTPMVIRPTNHFLFKKEVNPPQWLAVLETASLFYKICWNEAALRIYLLWDWILILSKYVCDLKMTLYIVSFSFLSA